MVIINDISMGVLHRRMKMRMAVGFGSFPTFMVMIVMETMDVFVLVGFLRVDVHQVRLVMLRPQHGSQDSKHQGTRTENQCCGFHAEVGSELTCDQIENQPTGVGQSELGGKIGGPIRR
jgi:hypothetical protein